MAPRSLLWPDPRVKPPFGAAEIDWTHPLAAGLVWCLLFNEGHHIPANLIDGRELTPVSVYLNGASGAAGLGTQQNDGVGANFLSYWVMGVDTAADAKIPTAQFTMAVIRANTDTNIGGATGFIGNSLTSGVSEVGIYAPYQDGVLYFDFGGASGANRISWSYGTKSPAVERHVFVAGSGGSAIYLNGVLKASQGTGISRTVHGTNTVKLGRAPDDSQRSQLWTQALILNAQWSAGLVQWWTAEPYAMLRPLVRRRYFVPPATGVTYPQLERGIRGLNRGLTVGMR
jgi:hypothetical protein